MRLRTTMLTSLAPHRPDREHGDDDRNELQRHAPAHQLLRQVWRATAHHVDETEQEHQRDGGNRNGKNELAEKESHRRYITPRDALRHPPVPATVLMRRPVALLSNFSF